MAETEYGLSEKEARKRLLANGPNRLRKRKGKNSVQTFLEQLKDPLIYVLFAAGGISVLLGEISDAFIIFVVVFLNACLGTIQEGKAQKALEALKDLQCPTACCIRDGILKEIPAEDLVVGDLVCLEAGSRVPADLILTETVRLSIEESALTGEAVPAEKDARFLSEGRNLSLGDQKNKAFLSTMVTGGRGKGIVCAVGMNTELGKIADMVGDSSGELTPLQKRLGELGKVLSILSLLLCASLFGIAVLQNRDLTQMLLTAISLAVAAVPEGLPAIVTICLALSVTRMVKKGTIVRKLPSIETLGAVNIVCSDKTGTLTQNKMTVEEVYYDGKFHSLQDGAVPPAELLLCAALCNDARLGKSKEGVQGERTISRKNGLGWKGKKAQKGDVGDPTEIALLSFARHYGVEREKAELEYVRVNEIPFDAQTRQMLTVHQWKGGKVSYRKGAPDVIVPACVRAGGSCSGDGNWREKVFRAAQELSGKAYRVLALAKQEGSGNQDGDWVFLGLLAMKDPARPEAAKAVGILKQAGVRTIMITGDQADTALAIGMQLGIACGREECLTGTQLEDLTEEEFEKKLPFLRIFARVSPTQKVRIVKAFQKSGRIVAMTGDGVNDAPSLKAADIGIAMGKCGTDVAKQAADMILTDDNFATIEKAIEEGRGVYENIRKSVIFLLSSNLGELLTMFTAVIFGFSAPLKSSHILWINLITDSLPALALGIDKNDGRALMKNSPRKESESLFARGGLACTVFYGFLIAGISLTAFCYPILPALLESGSLLKAPEILRECLMQPGVLNRAQTYAFTVLGLSQLFHAIGMRDVNVSVIRMKHDNRLMFLAVLLGILLQGAVTEIPVFVRAFGTVPLKAGEWLLLTGLSMIPLLSHELIAITAALFSKEEE